MSLWDGTAQRFLRIAATRWPAEIRDDQAREWAGELYAIKHDPGRGRLLRGWAQLRFAFSLAASPPVDDPNQIPKGWRELLPQFGHTMRRVLMLVAVGAMCATATALTSIVNPDPRGGIIRAFAVIALAAILAELGRRLGRIAPLSTRHGKRGNSLATAAVVMACVGVALMVVTGDSGEGMSIYQVLPYLVWMVGFGLLLTHVFRLSRSGRVKRAWLWGIGGGLVLFEVIALPLGVVFGFIGPMSDNYVLLPGFDNLSHVDFTKAPLWFPMGLLGGEGVYMTHGGIPLDLLISEAVTYGIAWVMPELLAATGFAVGYLTSSGRYATGALAAVNSATDPARTAATAPAAETGAASEPVAFHPGRRYLGLAAAAIGILAWAFVLGVLTPANDHDAAVGVRESGYWAIVLAALGLAWARSQRGGIVIPSVGFGVAAVAAGVVIDRVNSTGAGAFLLVAGVGGALAVAAWLIPTTMDSRGLTKPGGRRALVAIAVFAAYSAASASTQARFPGGYSETATLSIGMPVIWSVLGLTFITLSVVAAWTARRSRLSARGTILVFGPPVLLVAVVGWVGHYGTVIVDSMSLSTLLLLPLVLYIVATIQWDTRERGPADYAKWGLGILGSNLLSLVAFVPQLFVGIILGDALIKLSAPGIGPADGASLVPGLLLAAAVLATFFGWWTQREPAPKPVTPTTDGPVTGGVAHA